MEQSWTELHHRTCDFVAFSVVKAVENAGLENEKPNSSTGKNNAPVLLYFPAVLFGLSFSVLHFLSSLVSPVLKKSCVLTTAYVLLTDELLLIAEHMSSSKCRMSNSL